MGKPQMTRATLRVLAVLLRPGPHYGLEVLRAAGLPSGLVYPLLDRLEARRWLTGEWEWPRGDQARSRAEGRPPRRYLHLTARGRTEAQQALEAERRALA